jgi:hypothetical protein
MTLSILRRAMKLYNGLAGENSGIDIISHLKRNSFKKQVMDAQCWPSHFSFALGTPWSVWLCVNVAALLSIQSHCKKFSPFTKRLLFVDVAQKLGFQLKEEVCTQFWIDFPSLSSMMLSDNNGCTYSLVFAICPGLRLHYRFDSYAN